MNSVTAINAIRDNLRTNLTDPYSTAGGTRETGTHWIWSDEPIISNKFPRIKLEKLDNPTAVLTIGSDYWEYEQVFINIMFETKNGFGVTVSGTEYKNAQLVEYYLDLIKTTLKAQFNTLFAAGVKNYKHVNTTYVEYDEKTQIYYGFVTIRVAYFRQ